jgi:hypothetical protein
MVNCQIVTVMLVKNEDIFLQRVLQSISEFSDEIIIADNCSTDETAEIADRFVRSSSKFHYQQITDPRNSHELIQGHAGKNVWVFGVDGDELYDAGGLRMLRSQLLDGKYDDYWMLLGNVLHCTKLDSVTRVARGYMAPPCRSMTKLYNFSLINSWNGNCQERLHGGLLKFKEGYGPDVRKYLYKEVGWDDSIFRCLHLCFLPRSSNDRNTGKIMMRPNIADAMVNSLARRIKDRVLKMVGKVPDSTLKRQKYMRGAQLELSVEAFLD